MSASSDNEDLFKALVSTGYLPKEQVKARAGPERDAAYYNAVVRAYFHNPFLVLQADELAYIEENMAPPALGKLVAAREAAARVPSKKYAVCCMPKSGSSFVQSALKHALGVPHISLTTFGSSGASSAYGMNARAQEIDELALVSASLASRRGFVTQIHAKYSPYLAFQFQRFRVQPVVTVRSIPDCIVSFDDMMIAWRSAGRRPAWLSDTQFTLPENYPQLSRERRYGILARSYGIWLINFYVSWKRCEEQAMIRPVVLRYEDDILDTERFVSRLSGELRLSPEQTERLAAYARSPDREGSRFNVGRPGRGRQNVPDQLKEALAEHASAFHEISKQELAYLVPLETQSARLRATGSD